MRSLAAAGLVGCSRAERPIPGSIVGGSAAIGHRLRETPRFEEPKRTEEHPLVIIGAGIAGLTAARRLTQAGRKDTLLLELEPEFGGTARAGKNAVSAYPWAAHYVPIANPESTELIRLFEELGLITGRAESGAPIYAEEMLCADPGERLFQDGRWHEGLLPRRGLSREDERQYAAFFAEMDALRWTRGNDGAPIFAIPLDLSSRDPEYLALDAKPFAEWLDERGYNSRPLRWHIGYGCRDDYGADATHVSAWAGLHYFASRRGWAANAARDAVLTWPEGNGWLAGRLRSEIHGTIRTGVLAHRIEQDAAGVTILCTDARSGETLRLRTPMAICATPRFVAQRIIPDFPPAADLVYSPWMVANVTLDRTPNESSGAPLSWDNVMQASRSLGYVVATHQALQSHPSGTVLTHYWPLDRAAPPAAREEALQKTHAAWCREILDDLAAPHPEIRELVRQIDVYLWGHGMIRPVPGFIWGGTRRAMLKPHGRIHFAHTDMSGVALFEEAHHRGLMAAEAVLAG
jgi:hypothetical protein